VLFSEPKIPQFNPCTRVAPRCTCFSALQRAENSSMQGLVLSPKITLKRFSALQRAENSSIGLDVDVGGDGARFSALQRAENSSIQRARESQTYQEGFQCSSASRKFLNSRRVHNHCDLRPVSVLFSEPKIPQSYRAAQECVVHPVFQCSSASRKFLNKGASYDRDEHCSVSVLFSEPKIPQFASTMRHSGC